MRRLRCLEFLLVEIKQRHTLMRHFEKDKIVNLMEQIEGGIVCVERYQGIQALCLRLHAHAAHSGPQHLQHLVR